MNDANVCDCDIVMSWSHIIKGGLLARCFGHFRSNQPTTWRWWKQNLGGGRKMEQSSWGNSLFPIISTTLHNFHPGDLIRNYMEMTGELGPCKKKCYNIVSSCSPYPSSGTSTCPNEIKGTCETKDALLWIVKLPSKQWYLIPECKYG